MKGNVQNALRLFTRATRPLDQHVLRQLGRVEGAQSLAGTYLAPYLGPLSR
jgi:hypothetical protein